MTTQTTQQLHNLLRQVMRAVPVLYPSRGSLPDEVRQTVGYLFTNRAPMQ